MNIINKVHIYITVVACFFLFGCVAAQKLNISEDMEYHEAYELAAEETAEGSNILPIPRRAPVKEAGNRYAYLTIDDGPSHNTDQILDILSDFQIKATFFVVGRRILHQDIFEIDADAILNRVFAEGHYVGLHSMSHNARRLYEAPNANLNFYNEMREVQNLLYEASGGYKTSLYRAPYGSGSFTGAHVRQMAGSGLRLWDWNIDTMDWNLRSVDAVLARVKRSMEASGNPNNVVILMHENNFSVVMLPYLIRYYLDLGYTFVPYHPDNHFQMNLLGNPDL